jgi:AraC-like DNA-binding protein
VSEQPSDSTIPHRRWLQQDAGKVREWQRCMEHGSLAVFLNFQGEADMVWQSGTRLLMRPGRLYWVRGPEATLTARRLPGRERHECLALYYPDHWISRTLQNMRRGVHESYAPLVTPPFPPHASFSQTLSADDKLWAQSFMAPHLCEQARHLLDSARLTEFFLRRLFQPGTPAGEPLRRTDRLARERIERVKAAVLPRLDEPPALEELAVVAGCSLHYLSRTFSQVEGLNFSLWLRRERIEKAAALIASGQCNVSEAAVEVGYHSFSHFSRAFFEEKGVKPSRWGK